MCSLLWSTTAGFAGVRGCKVMDLNLLTTDANIVSIETALDDVKGHILRVKNTIQRS